MGGDHEIFKLVMFNPEAKTMLTFVFHVIFSFSRIEDMSRKNYLHGSESRPKNLPHPMLEKYC